MESYQPAEVFDEAMFEELENNWNNPERQSTLEESEDES